MNKKPFSKRVDWALAVICGFLASMGLMYNKINLLLFAIFIILVVILDVLLRKFND
jgi:hypothetical protein